MSLLLFFLSIIVGTLVFLTVTQCLIHPYWLTIIICEYIWILLCVQNSRLLHLKGILDGAIGNVNKVLKAKLQRECVRSLSAQGHKSTPRALQQDCIGYYCKFQASSHPQKSCRGQNRQDDLHFILLFCWPILALFLKTEVSRSSHV